MPTRPFTATDRDLRLLAELGEVGLMSTPLLVQRHFPGFKDSELAARAFRRRLRAYQALSLVESAAIPVRHRTGSTVLAIHTLTNAGAEFVTETTGQQPPRAATSLDLSPVTLPHRLGVIATRLAFDDAHRLAGLPQPAWLHEFDLSPQARPTGRNEDRFILYEAFQRDGQRLVCWPDAATRLALPDQPGHALLAYLEYDRSTETAKQLAAKVPPYYQLVAERRYQRHWNVLPPHVVVRVLFVCRSTERLTNAIEAIRDQPGTELFRFATYADLTPAGLLTTAVSAHRR